MNIWEELLIKVHTGKSVGSDKMEYWINECQMIRILTFTLTITHIHHNACSAIEFATKQNKTIKKKS